MSRRKSGPSTAPSVAPMPRAAFSGRRRRKNPSAETAAATMRPLNALRFRLSTLESLDDGLPLAALAQQALHQLAEGPLAAVGLELPPRGAPHLGGCIGGRGGEHRPPPPRPGGGVVAPAPHLGKAQPEPRPQ